jgi:hypothetical protein
MHAFYAISFFHYQAICDNIQVSLFFVLTLFFDYSCTRCFCSENKTCFKSIVGEERDDLLKNISETMTKPLGIQATAHRFEVTFPPGPLDIDIGEHNKMCVVRQVRNSDEEFPLLVNDIIVSVNDSPMAKWNGDTEMFANVFKGSVSKTKKVVILRYTTK